MTVCAKEQLTAGLKISLGRSHSYVTNLAELIVKLHVAVWRMRTELSQALCLQRPRQLY